MRHFLFLGFGFLFVACQSVYAPKSIQYQQIKIDAKNQVDSGMQAFLSPYSGAMQKQMDSVIATLSQDLEKKQPEGSLGSFMIHGLIWGAIKNYGPVDAAVINSGGIRLQQIKAGPITVGKIFELMPFDNTVVVVALTGEQVLQLCQVIAEKGGWPIGGITMQIENKKATAVQIGGKAIRPEQRYYIATTDFIANGGDNVNGMKTAPRQDKGILYRDVLIDFCKKQAVKGPLVVPTINAYQQ